MFPPEDRLQLAEEDRFIDVVLSAMLLI